MDNSFIYCDCNIIWPQTGILSDTQAYTWRQRGKQETYLTKWANVSEINTPFRKGSDTFKHNFLVKIPVQSKQREFLQNAISTGWSWNRNHRVFMLRGETGAFIVAVGRRENRRGCEIIEKILKVACILYRPCSWKINRSMFPWTHWIERRGRRLCSPRHVDQEDAGRDSLALNWNPTVQNALCVEEEEKHHFGKFWKTCLLVDIYQVSKEISFNEKLLLGSK